VTQKTQNNGCVDERRAVDVREGVAVQHRSPQAFSNLARRPHVAVATSRTDRLLYA
jgi:hypothetical protein